MNSVPRKRETEHEVGEPTTSQLAALIHTVLDKQYDQADDIARLNEQIKAQGTKIDDAVSTIKQHAESVKVINDTLVTGRVIAKVSGWVAAVGVVIGGFIAGVWQAASWAAEHLK